MGDDTNSGPTGEQPTSADIDQGALAQLKRQLGELTGGELDLTDVQVIKGGRAPGPARPRDQSVAVPGQPGHPSAPVSRAGAPRRMVSSSRAWLDCRPSGPTGGRTARGRAGRRCRVAAPGW